MNSPNLTRVSAVLLLLSPVLPATDLTGFPFQNETLRYNVNWPSGLSLGEAVFTAHKTDDGFLAGTRVAWPAAGLNVSASTAPQPKAQ